MASVGWGELPPGDRPRVAAPVVRTLGKRSEATAFEKMRVLG